MSQPQPPPYNPYNQPPAMPQAPPGYGAPQQPYAGQPPMQSWQQPPTGPGLPYPPQPMPFAPQENRGHPVGDWLYRTAWSYRVAALMLSAVGTSRFTECSTLLYGHPSTHYRSQDTTTLESAAKMLEITDQLIDARFIPEITHMEALQRRLRVMDSTALTLCMENRLPIYVFNMDDERNIDRIVSGERVGTLVKTQ